MTAGFALACSVTTDKMKLLLLLLLLPPALPHMALIHPEIEDSGRDGKLFGSEFSGRYAH